MPKGSHALALMVKEAGHPLVRVFVETRARIKQIAAHERISQVEAIDRAVQTYYDNLFGREPKREKGQRGPEGR